MPSTRGKASNPKASEERTASTPPVAVQTSSLYDEILWPRVFFLVLWHFLALGENVTYSVLVCVFLRHVFLLHGTWSVNSWAHMYGYRPYDTEIFPVEASIRYLMGGEGFHNYHHVFPGDYSASELGPLDVFNPTTAFIDFWAKMGWASNLKRANRSLIEKKVEADGEKNAVVKGNFAKEWIGGSLAVFAFYIFLPACISYAIQ